jgi:hypothetical protein
MKPYSGCSISTSYDDGLLPSLTQKLHEVWVAGARMGLGASGGLVAGDGVVSGLQRKLSVDR